MNTLFNVEGKNTKIYKILWGDKYALMKIYRLDNNEIDP